MKNSNILKKLNAKQSKAKKNEKLDRAQKCLILGPQNLGWGGGLLDSHLLSNTKLGPLHPNQPPSEISTT